MARPSLAAAAAMFAVFLTLSCGILGASGATVPFYCRLNEVQCPSGIKSCVLALGICNGVKDCPDGSDENAALCKKYNCSNIDSELSNSLEVGGVPFFRTSKCPSGNMCTKKYTFEFNPEEENFQTFFRCTGGPKECVDGSDEDPRFCKNLDCTKGEYGAFAVTCPSKNYCLYPVCDRCGDNAEDRLCNGLKDCPDGSDEWPAFCKTRGCSFEADSTFRCKDFGCVRTEQICNGVRDCGDGSDEDPTFCASYSCPWSEGNKCPDRKTCLKRLAVCDGKKNCPDGSDELPAKCRTYTCQGGTRKCNDGLQCGGEPDFRGAEFTQDPRCNNKYDCKDKSDETSALCKTYDCGEFSAKCPGTGSCIFAGLLCDGKPDCLDGSDEGAAFCAKYKCDAVFSKLKCKNNRCVTGKYCDGRVDCEDKSDEDPAFCKAYTCPAQSSKCPGFPYQCVPNEFLCDGTKKHCINGGDESPDFCRKYTCPGVKCGLQCKDGRFCNNENDCPDGSDERPAFCQTYKCPKDFAKCKDGKQCMNFYELCRFDGRSWDICKDRSESDLAFCSKYDCGASQGTGFFKCTPTSTKCFDVTSKCDGIKDCANNVDEDPMTCLSYKCPEDYTKCPDKKQCIYLGKYCDGTPDCNAGGDEDRAFCTAYKCPIVRGVQFIKCPDNLRCRDPAIPC
eukprot:TRINITY_DN8569_c1_g1_i2.p1 TRINITY_DN8569_c1_g1~~TRINITY_DN8569_c1_g1_i2.p1  ORF type:complete len:673 (-),score=112.13 TRINITY_DN8569_c1_g1_i2:314-2332(-)